MQHLSVSNPPKFSHGTSPMGESSNARLWSDLDEVAAQSLMGGQKLITAVIKPFKSQDAKTNISYSGVYHW